MRQEFSNEFTLSSKHTQWRISNRHFHCLTTITTIAVQPTPRSGNKEQTLSIKMKQHQQSRNEILKQQRNNATIVPIHEPPSQTPTTSCSTEATACRKHQTTEQTRIRSNANQQPIDKVKATNEPKRTNDERKKQRSNGATTTTTTDRTSYRLSRPHPTSHAS